MAWAAVSAMAGSPAWTDRDQLARVREMFVVDGKPFNLRQVTREQVQDFDVELQPPHARSREPEQQHENPSSLEPTHGVKKPSSRSPVLLFVSCHRPISIPDQRHLGSAPSPKSASASWNQPMRRGGRPRPE